MATSAAAIAGVGCGASTDVIVVAVSISSSDCAGPLVRFEWLRRFLGLFWFLRHNWPLLGIRKNTRIRDLLRKLGEGVKLRKIGKF